MPRYFTPRGDQMWCIKIDYHPETCIWWVQLACDAMPEENAVDILGFTKKKNAEQFARLVCSVLGALCRVNRG
jgi:hypothetical protein